jgi:simple sugar transport system substrate-binding protein
MNDLNVNDRILTLSDASRRRLLAAGALGASGLALPGALRQAFAQAPFTMGVIYVGPRDDFGYNQAHAEGVAQMKKLAGVKVVEEENVPETQAVQKSMQGMISQDGAKLLFPTSFGYFDPHMLAVAGKNAGVRFAHCGGLWTQGKHPANTGSFFGYIDEAQYLNGVIAGHMSKSKKLGFVAAKPIPQVLRNINAFTMGAQSVNPKIKTKVVWVNEWFNPPKETEAATALINGGADVLMQNTDSPAVLKTAQERGKRAFGWDSDMTAYGPKAHLGSAVINWGPYYIKSTREALEGTWKGGESVWWGVKEGAIDMVGVAEDVPADIKDKVEKIKAGLKDGSFHIWKGPIVDNTGKEQIAKDTVADDKFLGGVKFYVKGVEGKVPGEGK